MKKIIRVAVCIATGAMLVLPSNVATAHVATNFSSCVSRFAHTGGFCKHVETVHSGHSVFLRGRSPSHPNTTADVERRNPERGKWRTIGDTETDADGRLEFEWKTRDNQQNRQKPWRLRFSIPGHGKSETSRVFVT